MARPPWRSRRLERRLLALTDEVVELRRQEALAVAELGEHRRLHDDARLDADGGNAADRAAYREIAGDVARFEQALAAVRVRLARVDDERRRLLDGLT